MEKSYVKTVNNFVNTTINAISYIQNNQTETISNSSKTQNVPTKRKVNEGELMEKKKLLDIPASKRCRRERLVGAVQRVDVQSGGQTIKSTNQESKMLKEKKNIIRIIGRRGENMK